jgi:hypothetical protein
VDLSAYPYKVLETKDDLKELYNWVISPNIEMKDLDKLEKKLKEKYYILPNRIWGYGKTFDYSIDKFIIELFQNIEYSNGFLFLILNKGRKYLNYIILFLTFFLLSGIFSLGIIFRIIPFLRDNFQFIILPGILVVLLLDKCSEKIFNQVLIHMKPGDLLKILMSKDEIIIKKIKMPMVVESSIFSNPSASAAFSKKTLVCKDYKEKIKPKIKNLYNLAVNFIATDFLINNEQNLEIQNDLRKQAIDTLTYILAFRNDSIFTLYNLAINELELMNLDKSLKYFLKIYEIDNDNIEINGWINVINFIIDIKGSNDA